MAGNLRFDVSATNSATGEFTEIAAQLEEVGRQLRAIDGKTARAKVSIATDGAAGALKAVAEVDAALKALPNTTKTTVNVDVDKDAPGRIASLISNVTKFGSVASSAASGVSKLRDAARVLVDPASLPIVERATDFIDNKFRRAVELAAPAVDKLRTVLTGLRTGLLGLSAAGSAVQLIGSVGTSLVQLSGVVALAPALLLGAAAGVATLKTAFAGFGDAVDAKTPKAWAEATKDMAPAAVATAAAVRVLKEDFKGVQQAVQTNFFAGFADQVKSLGATYIPLLQAGLGLIAEKFGTMGRAALAAVQNTQQVTQVRTIFADTAKAVGKMEPALANVVLGILQLGAAGARYLPQIGTAVNDLAEKFRAWTLLITMDGSFDKWVRNGVTALHQLGTILGNLVSIGSTVFSALNGNGAGFLATLVSLTTQLRTFLASAQGATALQALATTLKAAGDAGQHILAAALQQLGPLLSALAPLATAFATAIGDHLVTVINLLGPLLTALATNLAQHPALLQAVAAAAAAVAIGFGPVTAILGPLISLLQGLVIARVAGLALAQLGLDGTVAGRVLMALVSPMALLREAAPLLARGFGMLVAQLGIMAGPVGVLIVAFTALYASSSQFRDAVNGVASTIGGLLLQALTQAGAVLASTLKIIQALATGIGQALSGLTDFGSKLASVFGPAGEMVSNVLTAIFNHLGVLPGAALAAFAAFMVLGRIAPLLNTASLAVAGFATRLQAFQGSSTIITGGVNAAGNAVSKFSTVLSKMGTALPLIGVALVALGAVYEEFGSKTDEIAGKVVSGTLSMTQAIAANQAQIDHGQAFWLSATQQQEAYAQGAQNVRDAVKQQYDALSPMQKLQADVAMGQQALNDAVAQFGAGSEQARSAGTALAAAQDRLKTAQQGAADAAKSHDQALKDLADQMASQVSTALAYEQAVRRTADAQKEASAALTQNGAKSKEYQDAVLSLAQAMSAQADAARRQAEALGGPTAGVAAYNTELLRTADLSTQAGRDAFIKIASGMDAAGLAMLSAAAKASGLRTEIIKLPNGKTVTVVVAADRGKLPEVQAEAETFAAKKYVGTVTINGNTDLARNAVLQAVTLADGTKATIKISGDASPSILTVGQTKYTIDNTTGTIQVLGNVAPGEASLNGLKVKTDATTGQMTITANDAPASQKLSLVTQKANTSIGTITIDGNATLANGKVTTAVTFADGSKGTITIDGNQVPANGKIDATVTKANGSTGVVKVDANAQAANAAIDNAARNRTSTITVRYTFEGGSSAGNARLAGASGGAVVGFSGGGVIHADSGYVLPGYSPGRDTVPAVLSRGESVLVPELTRALGARRIMAANAEASGGRQGSAIGNLAGLMDGTVGTGRAATAMSTRGGTSSGSGAATLYAQGLAAVAGQVGQLRGDVQTLGKVIGSARAITVEDKSGNPVETARAAALTLRFA